MSVIKKFALRSLKLFVSVGFALSTMTMPHIQANALDSNNIPYPNPGSIAVDKVAADLGGGLFEVTLTITGIPVVKSSDIVLVLDNSTSMSGAKITAMKTAAKNFVTTIIGRNEGHRIAIVRFADSVVIVQNFSQNATTLNNAIDGINASGRTHLEGGIYVARNLLASATAIPTNMKNIVVLGDGFPTRGYEFNPIYTGPVVLENRSGNRCRETITTANLNNPANYSGRYSFDYGTSFSTSDTSTVIFSHTVTVQNPCPNGAYATFDHDFSLADSVLWQAQQAWASGYTVFSIGLNVDTVGRNILDSIDNGGYYNGNTGDLSGIYAQIASQILQAGTNAVLTDKMGANFTFQNISTGYTSLNTAFNPTTEILTWNIGTIGSGPLVLKYIVKIDDGLPSGHYPTNEYADLAYTNINGQSADKTFPQPLVEVLASNEAPVAVADSYSIDEDGILNVNAANGVLKNDTDADADTLTAIKVSNPSHGTVVFNSDGSFIYTPTANFHGSDSFTYKANDGEDDSNVATVTITVNAVNDAPVAVEESYSTPEDTLLIVPTLTGVLLNDSDIDGDMLTAVLVSDVAHGELVISADGSFSYMPDLNYVGPDSFTYHAYDGGLYSNTVTVSLSVGSENDAPVAVEDGYTVDEDAVLTVPAIGVLANDLDADGDALTAVLVSDVLHGTLVLNADGSFVYTPTADYNGQDSFTYHAFDGSAYSNTVTVEIKVKPVNDAPVAADDSYSVDEDAVLNVPTLTGVLANDTDIDGDALTAALVSDVAHGTLVLHADGSFDYTPTANYVGADSFTYRANDGTLDSNIVTVSITVKPINDAPVAVKDEYNVNEDSVLNVPTLTGVLANDTDIDGDALNAVKVSDVSHGTLVLNADGSFDYTPFANYNGPDSFTYKANDGTTDSNIVTVDITVVPINDAPVAVLDIYSTDEDTLLNVPALTGVLANDSDIDGDSLIALLVSDALHGDLTLNSDGSFSYMPDPNFTGQDSFTYNAYDGDEDSNIVTVTINVGAVNDAPSAVDDAYGINEDGTLTVIDPNGILSNDSDPEVDALTAIVVSDVSHGTLTLNADGTFTYVPAANFFGTDTFTYQANDGLANSNLATVTITVRAINDAPVAVDDSYSTNEDTILNVPTLTGVLANDTDVEANALTASLIADVAHGTLVLNADGSFDYTPVANYNGPDSFTYKVNDGSADSNIATVSITVNPVNDAPVAVDDYYETDEDTPITIPAPGFYANDIDLDNAIYHNWYNSANSFGYLDAPFGGGGTFTYTPAENFTGLASFSYGISDGQYTSSAYIHIMVHPVNDVPVAVADAYSTNEDTPLNIPTLGVLSNDSDADSNPLSAILVNDVQHGTLVLNADGSFDYTPNADYYGADSFTYKANDGTVDSNTVIVNITVEPVNDVPVAADDAYSINEDTLLSVPTLSGVLVNDTDTEGNPLTAILVADVAHGTLVLHADGSFDYTPVANYNGPDSFTYKANDGTSDSNTVTVNITVNPVNDVPVAADDLYIITEDTVLSVLPVGILVNDTDIEGASLTTVLVSGPANGTLTLNANGSFTYTPAANFNGTDSFVYRAFDGTSQSGTATVTITVTPVNDAPTAAPATYTIQRGTAISRLLARGDIDGDPLTFEIVEEPLRGSLTVNAAGRFVYTNDGIALTSDSFTYRVFDGTLYSATRTITINFTDLPAENTAPVVTDASFDTPFNTPLNQDIAPFGSDADANPLTFILVTQPAHGTVTMSPSGSFHYVPNATYSGPDSFTFKANDGTDDSNVATVNINVAKEIIITPDPTPQAQMPWWWLLGLLPFLLFLIRRPRPEVQEVVLNPDGTVTTTWGYLGPRLMHKDYDRDESVLEVVSGNVKVVPPVEVIPYEFDRGRHENIFKTVSDKNAVIRWTIKKKAEELDKELVEKMLEKNKK